MGLGTDDRPMRLICHATSTVARSNRFGGADVHAAGLHGIRMGEAAAQLVEVA